MNVGDGSPEDNILEREIFFLKNEKYALKPEGTSSIARAAVTEKLLSREPSPLKFFYHSQCFRHERPQKNRYREFTQFGVEIINAFSEIYDIELVIMMEEFLRERLRLKVKLRLHYLSSKETRQR
ncbi:hypothetical protein PVNG_02481 [Plasmodium vivax North Korean]|uniref:histidine--tRNA ligase n=1 Tax=Plasmodium vivax North Korean TaxID=1035514 RepID=A0A0J9W6W0_PLAVI|nr:hypothetical protein PVNG_02481 [Plasmodium vivax North Korean]